MLSTSIIVRKNDPLSLYLGKYVRNDDYNARFIYHGSEETMLYMEEKEPGLWIENLDFESGKNTGFLETIQKAAGRTGMELLLLCVAVSEAFHRGFS